MYKKNISLALLEITFRLPATTLNPDHDNSKLSPRVVQIGLFLDQYFDRLSAFDDIKGYVAELGFEEVRSLMENVVPRIVEVGSHRAACIDRVLTMLFRAPTRRGGLFSRRWSASCGTSSPPALKLCHPSLWFPMAKLRTNHSNAGCAPARPLFPASVA